MVPGIAHDKLINNTNTAHHVHCVDFLEAL